MSGVVPSGDEPPRQNCRSALLVFCADGAPGEGCAVRAIGRGSRRL